MLHAIAGCLEMLSAASIEHFGGKFGGKTALGARFGAIK